MLTPCNLLFGVNNFGAANFSFNHLFCGAGSCYGNDFRKADGRLSDCDLELIEKIQDHVKEYGPELSVKANALNEE